MKVLLADEIRSDRKLFHFLISLDHLQKFQIETFNLKVKNFLFFENKFSQIHQILCAKSNELNQFPKRNLQTQSSYKL